MDLMTQRVLEHLAGRWNEVDTAALSPGFALLTRGTPVRAQEIAAAAGTPESRVLSALSSDHVGKDEHGHLVELFGVSILPAAYRARFEGGELFTCCRQVRYFASPASAARFVSCDSRQRVVPVAELLALGGALHRAV